MEAAMTTAPEPNRGCATASEPDRDGATAAQVDRGSVTLTDAFAVEADLHAPRATLALKGELDLASAPSLERAIEALPWPQLQELVIDLAELTFIDSTGLAVLIRTSQRAVEGQLRFSVIHVSDQARRLFTIAGVTDRLNLQI
jgi:anti-sigma B factor antagonist